MTTCPIRYECCVLALFFVFLGAPNLVFAQLGGAEQPRPSDKPLELPDFSPAPAQLFELPKIPPAAEEAPLSAGPRFLLRDVEFIGNTAFSKHELSNVINEHLGQEVSTDDLAIIRRKLTLHYVENGYINSGAVLPDQDIVNGVVRYAIIEGKLSEISITGTQRLRDYYLEDRISLSTDSPLNVQKLQERLQILLRDPNIERLDARLKSADRPGESELVLDVVESSPITAELSIANARAPSVGALETRGTFVFRNLAGFGEDLFVSLSRADGLHEREVSFGVPITARETRVFGLYQNSNSRIVEEPFDLIDVRSDSTDIGVGITHPVYRTLSEELVLGLEFTRRKSQTFLLGRGFPFSAGVEDDGTSVVSVFRFSQSWLQRSRDQVVAVRSTFSLGVDAFDATINPGKTPDSKFGVWLGQFQAARRFGDEGYQIIVRANAQLTPDQLLPLEKFSIGGVDTVRGYRENQLVRENGWTASIEGRVPLFQLRIPGLSTGAQDGWFELAPFFDYGRSWNRDVPTGDLTTLYSVGLGLRYQASQRVLGSVYVGKQLEEIDTPQDEDLQDHGVHFRVAASFF